MSNAIKEARTDVAAALETVPGLAVWQFIPEQLTAPAATVTSASPYVVPGRALGEYAVSLRVRLFVEGSNEMVTESLDELIVNVCEALRQEFGVTQVSAVGIDSESYAPATYLVADITINQINYKGGA